MQTQQITGGLAVAAMWEAREGEADAVADILARFAPMARQEPGMKASTGFDAAIAALKLAMSVFTASRSLSVTSPMQHSRRNTCGPVNWIMRLRKLG